jgi:DNA-directed RNA polymerase I, II, and III subunit RPABC5
MLIPIRCFSCNKVIADKWEMYQKIIADGGTEALALDTVGLKRLCCRRMYLGHVDINQEKID